MIYMLRYSTADDGSQVVDIAAIEDARKAQALEARGYIRCTRAAFRTAWRDRDTAALTAMHDALLEVERAVGQTITLPDGYRIYKA